MTISLNPRTVHYIQHDHELEQLLPILDSKTHLCVDTEFHAENRYTPKLMLIQIADLDQNTWIIDPFTCTLPTLAKMLQSKTLNMHGATEDHLLFHKNLGFLPTNIIDVQIKLHFRTL